MHSFAGRFAGSGKVPASISSYPSDERSHHDYLRTWYGRHAMEARFALCAKAGFEVLAPDFQGMPLEERVNVLQRL